jgi:hypothetical protein
MMELILLSKKLFSTAALKSLKIHTHRQFQWIIEKLPQKEIGYFRALQELKVDMLPKDPQNLQ